MGFSLHPSYQKSAVTMAQLGDAKRLKKDKWTSTDFVYDHNGNVTELLDGETGDLIGSYKYDPYGNTISIQGEAAYENKVRFSTKEIDSSGLYYYGYRYYNPQDGRWLNKDPIEEYGGVNLYGMVGNDSLNRYDWLGFKPEHPNCCSDELAFLNSATTNYNSALSAYENSKITLKLAELQYKEFLLSLETAESNYLRAAEVEAAAGANVTIQCSNIFSGFSLGPNCTAAKLEYDAAKKATESALETWKKLIELLPEYQMTVFKAQEQVDRNKSLMIDAKNQLETAEKNYEACEKSMDKCCK